MVTGVSVVGGTSFPQVKYWAEIQNANPIKLELFGFKPGGFSSPAASPTGPRFNLFSEEEGAMRDFISSGKDRRTENRFVVARGEGWEES